MASQIVNLQCKACHMKHPMWTQLQSTENPGMWLGILQAVVCHHVMTRYCISCAVWIYHLFWATVSISELLMLPCLASLKKDVVTALPSAGLCLTLNIILTSSLPPHILDTSGKAHLSCCPMSPLKCCCITTAYHVTAGFKLPQDLFCYGLLHHLCLSICFQTPHEHSFS